MKNKKKKSAKTDEIDEFDVTQMDFPSVNPDEDDADDLFDDDENGEKGVKKPKKKHYGSYKTMGLNYQLFKGIARKGYLTPTPIQRKTIPLILEGRDVVAMARTGSGKTAAFLIPLFEKLKSHSAKVGVRAIILTPTRELALQTLKFIKQIGKYMDIRSCLLVGGDSMQEQFADLATNPDIIVATPGRLVHHMAEVNLSLKAVEYIVFDEADRLFEMGLADQIYQIIAKLPEIRQTVLFSATLPQLLVDFAKAGLTDPELIRLDTETQISENLKVVFFTTRVNEKTAALMYLLHQTIPENQQTVVFAATRHHCEFLHELMKINDITSCVIYGTMDQTARKINIAKFRGGKTRVLLVTDVAARGIDIPLLDNVINYDFPARPKVFVHRVGRVARMGRIGTAFSLVSPDELPFMVDLHLFLGRKLQDSVTPGDSYSDTEVYYGRLPQDSLDYENDTIKNQIKVHTDLENLYNVTLNAYKLYYKTRGKPSPESVTRAKELPASNIHPMVLQDLGEGEQERNAFLEGIRTFKTKQTIFEVEGNKKEKNSPAAMVMQNARKFHAKAIAAKNATPLFDNDTFHDYHDDMTFDSDDDIHDDKKEISRKKEVDHSKLLPTAGSVGVSIVDLVHSSANGEENNEEDSEKNKRKRTEDSEKAPETNNGERAHKKRKSKKTKKASSNQEKNQENDEKSAKDSEYYMGYTPANQIKEKSLALNENIHTADIALDLVGDERETISSQKNVTKWDRKKKKFVKVTAGIDPNNRKKMRSESGVIIKEKERGKIYQEWKDKTKSELPHVGEDEDSSLVSRFSNQNRWKFQHNKGSHSATSLAAASAKSELKDRDQIVKGRKEKDKNKERQKKKKDRETGKTHTKNMTHAYKPFRFGGGKKK